MLLSGIVRRLLMLAIVLAVPVIGGELLARKLVGEAVAAAVRARIGVSPQVSLGTSPILLQLARGRIDDATLHARGAHLGALPAVTLTATLRDVHVTHLTRLQGAIGSLIVDAQLAPGAVRDLLATRRCIDALPPPVRTALTRAPRVVLVRDRVELLPPAGRAVELRLRPQVSRHVLRFRVSGLELAGAPAPAAALAAARASTSCARPLGDLPFGISLISAAARGGTLGLAFAATGATFSPLR